MAAGGIFYFGVVFGIVFQRSRFCLVHAFREPFLSGASEHARAAALALVMSLIGFAILKVTDLKDATEWVFPAFWFGALAGGFLFGIGMVLGRRLRRGIDLARRRRPCEALGRRGFFCRGTSACASCLRARILIRQLGTPVFSPEPFWLGRGDIGGGRADDCLVSARRVEPSKKTSGVLEF